MDTALILKQKVDSGAINNFDHAQEYLDKSEVLNALLTDFELDILNLLNRLVEIAEIPFAWQLEKIKTWRDQLADWSFCGEGFSISGKRDDLLACYNAMITSVLIRMHYPGQDRIKKGIEWILNYQNFQCSTLNKWSGTGVLKYGGCMKSTPCYIGVVKSVLALSDYKRSAVYEHSAKVESKIATGLEYILDHQIYLRQSNGQAITSYLTKLTYPFSYKTNLVEILRLLKHNKLDSDERCSLAKAFIHSKKRKDGYWRINSSYLPKCWVQFDKPGETGYWISYEINKLLQ